MARNIFNAKVLVFETPKLFSDLRPGEWFTLPTVISANTPGGLMFFGFNIWVKPQEGGYCNEIGHGHAKQMQPDDLVLLVEWGGIISDTEVKLILDRKSKPHPTIN